MSPYNAGQKAFRLTEAGQQAASEIDPKPWDQMAAETEDADAVGALWQGYGALAMAVKSVLVSGTPEQGAEASEMLTETRKRLFAILAEDAQS